MTRIGHGRPTGRNKRVTRVIVVLLSSAAVVAAFMLTRHLVSGTPTGAFLSLYLKQMPLCAAENMGITKPRRAFFSPAHDQTIDILRCTPAAPPIHEGKDFHHSLLIVSDFGGVVQRLAPNGRLMWERKFGIPRGIDVDDGKVYLIDGHDLHVLRLDDGTPLTSFPIGADALALRVHDHHLFVAFEDPGKLVEYTISEANLHQVRAYPGVLASPRGVDVTEDSIWIADTYNHRVLQLDRNSGQLVRQVASYFPNSVQVVGDRVLVAEEHLNRIGEFSRTLTRLPSPLGCATNRGLDEVEPARAAANRLASDGESACRRLSGGARSDLFSPNDFQLVDGMSYVADGDNHRIVAFRDGEYWGELSGFNSPVNVRAVAATH